MFSGGLQLEHCVGQGLLTIANQDGFFQRTKASEKSTGLPDQTALTPRLTPGLGKCPGEGNGNPLQYSCLGNPMDKGAWQATVHGVARVRYDLVTKPRIYL